MLVEWSDKCYSSERDLLFTRSILMYVADSNDPMVLVNAHWKGQVVDSWKS